MHCIEVIKYLNTQAAIKGVSQRAKSMRDNDMRGALARIDDVCNEALADRALEGDQTAWDAMVDVLAKAEAV